MATKAKSTSKSAIKVRDLKPNKDAKAGRGATKIVSGLWSNHNETFLRH
jgi:hypothetical protein